MPGDIRNHPSAHMAGLRELENTTEPAAVVVRPDGSLDVYGSVAVIDQSGKSELARLAAGLNGFDARQSDDPVKRDLELTCTTCGRHICDIEPYDTLGVLAGMAVDHECEAT